MKVLVTGFEAFGDVTDNPSAKIAAALPAATPASIEVVFEVLPVEYEASISRLADLIDETRPDAVVCLGVAASRDLITLEQVARREATSPKADNSGRVGFIWQGEGPDQLRTTLPVTLLDTLRSQQSRFDVSHDAGGYVCENLFYHAVRLATAAAIPYAGFVHVPLPGPNRSVGSLTECIAALLLELERHASQATPAQVV